MTVAAAHGAVEALRERFVEIGGTRMVVVVFKVRSQPDRSEDVLAALRAVVAPSRALEGTISFDIGRDIADPDSFIATEVFTDQAALERQEELLQVAKALGVLETALATEPEATIFHVSTSEPWG